MDAALHDLGRTLLFTLAPGAPFVTAMAILVAVLAAARHFTGKTRPVRAWLAGWRVIEHTAITLLLVSMVVFSLAQIVLRNMFETGFVWLDPMLRHGVLWLGFLGAMLATAQDRHISIDALSRLLRGTASHVVHALLRLLAAGVALALANAAYVLARDELEFESVSFLEIPTWVLMIIMPWGLVVMAYRFVLSAWRGRPPDPVPATGVHEGLPRPPAPTGDGEAAATAPGGVAPERGGDA